MILIIDNYDSFTYNLYQYIGELVNDVEVIRNDRFKLDDIASLKPEKIIISPGPGNPEDAGLSNLVIKNYGDKIPILGICLGHQCIGSVYGAKIVKAETLFHGKESKIYLTGSSGDLFKNIKSPFRATRYHSLIIERQTLPAFFHITAVTDDDIIMAIKHQDYPLYGLQFHPESILTDCGFQIIRNFIF